MKNFSLFPLSTNLNTRTGSFLSSLQKEINNLFDSSLSSNIDFNPLLDLNESDEEYEFRIELPGMSKENIKVEVSNRLLTITGKKETRISKKEHKTKHTECSYGEFSRSITLPPDADEDSITAGIKNGVLSIYVKKKQGTTVSSKRTINIENS